MKSNRKEGLDHHDDYKEWVKNWDMLLKKSLPITINKCCKHFIYDITFISHKKSEREKK